MTDDRQRIAVLDAPSNLGLRPPGPGRVPGVYKLAAALRAQQVVARLGALDAGVVAPPAYSPEADPATRFRNGAAISAYSVALAGRLAALVRAGHFPLVLGGDCSILLGNMLGLRRLGRYGLIFLDGHLDFAYLPTSPVFAAAGLDLALVTGHGPAALTDLDGNKPYVREEDVVMLGYREGPDVYPPEYDVQPFLDSRLHRYPLPELRRDGAEAAAQQALAAIAGHGLDGFWVHLDVDVLDPLIMPAVDSPDPPDGMNYDELVTMLAILLGSPRAVGIEVTIFDPELDPSGRLAAELTAAIVSSFARSKRFSAVRLADERG